MTKTQVTPEEKAQALAEFKSKAQLLDRDKDDDSTCFRFLRARQYNVDKAADMYNAYAKWRVDNVVDTVLDTPFAVDKNLWKHAYHGRDKEGRPIFIEPTGILDIKKIVGLGYKMDTLVRAHIYQQEYVAKLTEVATKREGRPIEQTLSILDLEGAGVWMHLNGTAREFFSILAGIAQNYYPERLYKLIVVNAPRAFPMAWNFIRPFLDINTQNKIIMPHYKDQLKVLLEHVDACFIPMRFGGQCNCEQRGCLTSPNPVNYIDALRYDEGPQIPHNNSNIAEKDIQITTTPTTHNSITTENENEHEHQHQHQQHTIEQHEHEHGSENNNTHTHTEDHDVTEVQEKLKNSAVE